jgi:DNA-binding MarR family transcriptional regulator
MAKVLPLPTLLSQALVAFTIEFDNEAEQRIPHTTTRYGSTENGASEDSSAADEFRKPWLVSMAMYLNCMQFLDQKGMTTRDLVRRARARTNFRGMHRWGYITVRRPEDQPNAPKAEWIVRPTAVGRSAQKIWKLLIGEIEDRWNERFGEKEIQRIREALLEIEEQFDLDLPDCMPIVGYAFSSSTKKYGVRRASAKLSERRLPVLLARVLLRFALEFESDSELSLAMSEDVLRVLDDEGALVRDLPRRAGVSKEAIAMGLKFLINQGYVVLKVDPAGARAKVVCLTAKGLIAQAACQKRLRNVEQHWRERFGEAAMDRLRNALEPLVGGATAETSPLFGGLEPPQNGWRAKVKKPQTLPHFPMISHRGGYPDGS